MSIRVVLLLVICLGSMTPVADAATPKEIFVAIRKDIAKTLDQDWANDAFTCILTDAQAMDAQSKAVAALLGKTLRDAGVVESLELSFSRTKLPLDNFSIKILWFTDSAKAAEFFRKKYIEHADFTVVNETEVIGKQLGKRARLIGPVSLSVFKFVRDDVATTKYLDLATTQVQKAIAP
jgi:hypothetical protein